MRSFVAGFVPRGSVVLAVTTLGSYVLGLLRDRIFARSFGASAALDSYYAAFLIPDFAFNLLVASGIAAAVVPIFTRVRQRDPRAAYLYVSSIMTTAVVVMFVTGVLIVITAPWLSRLVAPGLASEQHVIVVRLMRTVAFSPILFAASNALGAMLVAQKRFLFYGLSPLLYNIGIISGAVWLTPHFGIAGVAYGTLLGAGLHLVVRLIDALRAGWSFYPLLRLPVPQLKPTLRLMLPKMVGHPVELVTFGVFTSLASSLAAGSITVLNFARNFQSVPVSVIGIAMATAVFPALAEASLQSTAAVRKLLRHTSIGIFGASSLAALLMFVIRQPLVQILLGGGAFTGEAVERTALVLGIFCLSIPTESLSHLVARAFYATANTVIPVAFSVLSLVVSAGSAYLLSQSLGIIGLPLGFWLGSLVKTLGLLIAFEYRLNRQ